jgi:2-methylcitrate dehydratase PrpD
VVGGTGATKLLSEPLHLKRRPRLSIDAKFSIPFTSAIAMVHGNVALKHFTDDALHDPAVLAMADRVSYREETGREVQFGGDSATSRPTVEIRTVDGRLLSHRPDGMPGDPRNPVSAELLEAKFRDCVSFAARRVAADRVESAIDLMRKLDTVPDVREIIRLLS